MKTIRKAIEDYLKGFPESSTLGLSAIQLGKRNEWLQTVPLVEDMLERVEILQKRNRSTQRLTSSMLSSAPRPPEK